MAVLIKLFTEVHASFLVQSSEVGIVQIFDKANRLTS